MGKFNSKVVTSGGSVSDDLYKEPRSSDPRVGSRDIRPRSIVSRHLSVGCVLPDNIHETTIDEFMGGVAKAVIPLVRNAIMERTNISSGAIGSKELDVGCIEPQHLSNDVVDLLNAESRISRIVRAELRKEFSETDDVVLEFLASNRNLSDETEKIQEIVREEIAVASENGVLDEDDIDRLAEAVAQLLVLNPEFEAQLDSELDDRVSAYLDGPLAEKRIADAVEKFAVDSKFGSDELFLSMIQTQEKDMVEAESRHAAGVINLILWGAIGWLGFMMSLVKVLGIW